jgi:S1-C subfamily serine protease
VAGGLGAGLGIAFGGGGSTPASSRSGVSGRSGSSGLSIPSGNSGAFSTPGSTLPATSGNGRLAQRIANAVDPAVVDINVEDATAGPAAGTGMIVTSSGYVLTNNHVIDSAMSIEVTVAGHSSSYPAKVVGYDATDDVAVIKIEGVSGLPTVSFGDSSSATIGETVVAVGNALGQGGPPTVVSGTITALGRTISAGDEVTDGSETLHNLIQSDADIQPGDSGGPLVDSRGQVIGMDTAAASAESGSTLGFSIPINEARLLAAQMMSGKAGNGVSIGLAAFLGINAESTANGGGVGVSGTSGTSGTPASGVAIASVIQGSPAAQAGLQGGDVITAIDGKSTLTFTDLHDDIQAHLPGQQISVTYEDYYTGTSHTAEITLAGIPY